MTALPSQKLPWRDLYPPAMTASMLAFAGLPLYIHAPRYYTEDMGIGIAQLGLILLIARMIDSFQDPLIGRYADRWQNFRDVWALGAGFLLIIGILILFAPADWGEPLPRLLIGLLAAFTGFSSLQIVLYDHGLAQGNRLGGDSHTRVALWREAGGLMGVCLAASAPGLFAWMMGASIAYISYALLFVIFCLVTLNIMRGHWLTSGGTNTKPMGWVDAVAAKGVRPVLFFGFVNTMPTAVTSTLFLFFVADVIEADVHAGPMLIVFFSCAALAAPLWARLADRLGRKWALTTGMSLSIPVFIWAYLLGSGDVIPFYVIAAGSGAALGADMTLTPALLAERIRGGGGKVFSIWTFLQKSALAAAAGLTLPLLALSGYQPGLTQHQTLSVAYALVPCGLKVIAIVVLLSMINEQGEK